MPHCVEHIEGIEKEIPECFFNVSECFWQPVVIIIDIRQQRRGPGQRHRQATDGSFWTASATALSLFPSFSLCLSFCVLLPPLARQPRVCLSPAIAAVQMAHGISIIYRLWKPFTFVIYAGLTATGSLHSTHTNTLTHTHTLRDLHTSIYKSSW